MLDAFNNHVEIIKLQKQLKRTENNINTIDENYVATEGQTEFPIAYETFDYTKDAVFVTSGRTSLSEGLDYTLVASKVILTEGLPEGRTITIRILKNVRTEAVEPVTSGAYLEDGSVPLDKLGELPIPVSAGGTGATTAEEALMNLGGAKASDLTSHVSNTDNPHNVTPHQIGAATSIHTHAITDVIGGSNPNLLDNWYFADPINQRGITTWYGGAYGIDRWYLPFGTSATVGNGHIVLNNSCLAQKVAEHSQIVGKTVTLSVLFYDGFFASGTFSVPSSGISYARSEQPQVFYDGDDGTVGIYNAISTSILAVKLELGTQQTLARQENGVWVLNDAPPNKALEMAKCQRYFQTFATQSLRPTDENDFRPVMRTTPALGTIAVNGKTLYTACADL